MENDRHSDGQFTTSRGRTERCSNRNENWAYTSLIRYSKQTIFSTRLDRDLGVDGSV